MLLYKGGLYKAYISKKKKQCKHGFYSNHDRRDLIELLYPLYLLQKMDMKKAIYENYVKNVVDMLHYWNLHSINVCNCNWESVVNHLPNTYVFCRNCKLQL